MASAPQILHVVAQSSTSLRISWLSPKLPNGKIADYLISYWLKMDGNVFERLVTGVGHLEKTSALLEGLRSYQTYCVKVSYSQLAIVIFE